MMQTATGQTQLPQPSSPPPLPVALPRGGIIPGFAAPPGAPPGGAGPSGSGGPPPPGAGSSIL